MMYLVIDLTTKKPLCLTTSCSLGVEAARKCARAHQLCQGRATITDDTVEKNRVDGNSTHVISSMHVAPPNGQAELLRQEFLVIDCADLPTLHAQQLAGKTNPWIVREPAAA